MTLECGCPETFPDWDGQDINLGGDPILSLSLPTFLHMPMGYDLYVGRVRHIIKELELEERWPGFFLTRTGWFKGRIISPIAATDSPSHHISRMPSPYPVRARLHNGGIGTLKTTLRQLQAELLDSGRMPKELYLAHLTCPNCSEKRGGEKIMVLRHWKESPRLRRRIQERQ